MVAHPPIEPLTEGTRAAHELGGAAAASLAAADVRGWTPAHDAAWNGHEGCLRVLHELGSEAAASLVAANSNGWKPARPLTAVSSSLL